MPINEQDAVETLPPQLDAGRKKTIEAALAKFGEFEAKNARDALNQLSKLKDYAGEGMHYQDLSNASDNGKNETAYKLVEAYAGLAQGKAVSTRRAIAVKSDSTSRDSSKEAADPLYVEPFATTLAGLASINESHAAEKGSPSNSEWQRVLHQTAIGDNDSASTVIATLQLKYKGALSGLRSALKESNITPDEVIRYNAELKEHVISQTLGAFAAKGETGQDSPADTARKAVKTFKGAYASGGYLQAAPATESGILVLEKMGMGKSASPENEMELPYKLSHIADAMQVAVNTAPAADKKQYTDARALFIESMKAVGETFAKHSINAEDLKIYNGSLLRQEKEKQAAFKDLGADEKIKQFVADKANPQRYLDVATGISSLLAAKDALPETFDDDKKSPRTSIAENTDFLNAAHAHYVNKAAALEAVAKGDALTESQYRSIAEHPVVTKEVPRNSEGVAEKTGLLYSFEYRQSSPEPKSNSEENALRGVSDYLSKFRHHITSSSKPVLEAQADIKQAHNAGYPNPDLQGDAGLRLTDLEKKYDIVPDKIRGLAGDRKLKIADTATPVSPSASESSGIILLGDPKAKSAVVIPTDQDVRAATAGFGQGSSNWREFVEAQRAMTIEQSVNEKNAKGGNRR